MPLDDRLNNALRDNANTFEPDLDAAWDQIQRSRHRTTIRRTIALATVAAAVLVGLAITPRRDDEPVVPATRITTPAAIRQLTGHYRATIRPSDDNTDRYDLTGTWEVTFDPTGILDIRPPRTFLGVVSAQLYQLDHDQFRTDLFRTDLCSGTGIATYGWQTDEQGILRFTTIDDDCLPRATLWTTSDWQPIP